MVEPIDGGKPIDPNAVPGQTQAPAPGAENAGDQKTVPLAALHEEREKRQALQAEMEQLRDMVMSNANAPQNQYGQQQQYGQPPQQQFAPPPQDQLAALWEQDPRKAVQAEVAMAFDWRDRVEANLDYEIEMAKKQNPDFVKYEPEIRNYIRRVPVTQRGNRGLANMAYFVVKGQRGDADWKIRESELREKLKRGESVQGVSGTLGTPAPASGPQYTEDESKVAAAMGMSVEDYVKNRKK